MATDRVCLRHPRKIAGASAIEFAFVFPLLFAVVYGAIVYGYVYFLQQRINFAAEEAVRAAVAIAPRADGAAYLTAAQDAARNSVIQNFTGVGGAATLPEALSVIFPVPVDPNTLKVRLQYALKTPELFPLITLPMGIGQIPPLPDSLFATAVGRLS